MKPFDTTSPGSEMLQQTGGVPPVQMLGICKRFPGVVANDNIDLELRAGEVHSLLGENGAGKTTLMRILSGLYRQDKGTILLDGEPCDLRSPSQALNAGIGMVHQNFRLVDTLTAAENILLGWPEAPLLTSHAALRRRAQTISETFNLDVDPDAKIWQLSVGEQQRVEILRVLARGVRILILDEPTSVLTPHEAEELFRVVHDLAAKGHTVIFISHKLEEVLAVSDRITVLRRAKKIGTCDREECTVQSLAEMMVGRHLESGIRAQEEAPLEALVLEACGLSALGTRGLPALIDVSFDIRAREILGVAGVAGNGQTELAEVLTGMRPLEAGRILLGGEDVGGWNPGKAAKLGVGHIPEDRLGTGLISDASIVHNAILRNYAEPPISKGFRLDIRQAEAFAGKLVKEAGVDTPSLDSWVRLLSGGNQQRLLARREVVGASKVLVAVHPTRGLDLLATAELRQRIMDYRDRGGAVLLISEDLDEVLMMSDRVIVMYGGRIVGTSASPARDRERIGLLMGGGRAEAGV